MEKQKPKSHKINPDDHLWLLIRFMDKAEARHFRMVSRLQQGGKQYEYLYDEISRIKHGKGYNEAEVREKLDKEGKIPAGNFAVTKNYLFDALLKSLLAVNEKASVDRQIWKLYQEAQLLFERGIWDKSLSRLHKAKGLAAKYQRFTFLIDILALESKHALLPQTPAESFSSLIARLDREMKEAIESLAQENEYTRIRNQAFAFFRTGNVSLGEKDIELLKELKQTAALQTPGRFLSFHSEALYHQIWFLIHRLEGVNKQAVRHSARMMVEVWESHPLFQEEYPRLYKVALFTYLSACHRKGDYTEFEEMLEKTDSIESRTIIERTSDFHDYYHYQLLFLLNTGRYEAAHQLARSLEKKLAEYTRLRYPLRKNKLITLYHNIAILLFVTEQYEEAKKWTFKIRKELGKAIGRADIQYFARVLNLIILFEKGEDDKLDSRGPYLMRLLKGDELLLEFDEIVIRYIRKLSQSRIPYKDREIFEAFLKDIETLEAKLKMACGQREVKLWVQSKLSGQPMATLLREKSKAAMAKP